MPLSIEIDLGITPNIILDHITVNVSGVKHQNFKVQKLPPPYVFQYCQLHVLWRHVLWTNTCIHRVSGTLNGAEMIDFVTVQIHNISKWPHSHAICVKWQMNFQSPKTDPPYVFQYCQLHVLWRHVLWTKASKHRVSGTLDGAEINDFQTVQINNISKWPHSHANCVKWQMNFQSPKTDPHECQALGGGNTFVNTCLVNMYMW